MSQTQYTNADLVNAVIGAVGTIQDAHGTLVEVARDITIEPAPGKLPRAGADGKLSPGWIPEDVVSVQNMVRLGNGLKLTPEGLLYIDPWDLYPLRSPLPVQNVRFSGRNPIMPGETAARTNWLLCDGGTDGLGGNVPDLRGRFLLGSDASHAAGSTGGSENHTHSLSGNVGATTLSSSQLAGHEHRMFAALHNQTSPTSIWDKPDSYCANYGPPSGGLGYSIMASDSLEKLCGKTFSAGSNYSHNHALTGTTESGGSLPPYYALVYLIRIR